MSIAAFVAALTVGASQYQPAAAQGIISHRTVAAQIYAQMPELPLENHYERSDTGDVDDSNTLISRVVRYHLFVQRRQPIYRLDWKLTLADYLGVNDWVVEPIYPGADVLERSPRNGDMTAVRTLTLAQRQALVDALVAIYRAD
ncbi:MAG: hypothetical protein WBA10_08050 [Elainellaceae cyanobacterium]